MSRKPPKPGWKKLTLELKVQVLYLLIHKGLSQSEVSRIVGCSNSTVVKFRQAYCDLKVIRQITLKPSKKVMAKLIEAMKDEPEFPI